LLYKKGLKDKVIIYTNHIRMPRPAQGQGKYYVRTETAYHEYPYTQYGIKYIRNEIKCVDFDDALDILNFEKMCLDFTFFGYDIYNGNDHIFNNDPQYTIVCSFCRTPTTPRLKHKQFGNHLDKCKFKKATDSIRNIVRIFCLYNKYIEKFNELMKLHKLFESETNLYDTNILDYYKSHSYYTENGGKKFQLKQWKDAIQKWVVLEKEWANQVMGKNIHCNLANLKKLKDDKQFINKYFDKVFTHLEGHEVYEGFHNYAIDTIKKANKAYECINQRIHDKLNEYVITLKKAYNEDILKVEFETTDCGICIDEKLCRSTFCCRQKICADCSQTIKDGNAENTSCPFCRNKDEW